MNIKKQVYVVCFTILGILIGLLFSSIFQILFIRLYPEKFDYNYFQAITIFVLFISTLWGYRGGQHWWHQIYELKKYGRPWF